jgi:arginase
MERREFLRNGVAALGTQLLTGMERRAGEVSRASSAIKTYHVFGVPLRSGSLIPGNENDAQAYRDVQLVSRLQAAGCSVVDDGDVAVPSYLPHHCVPPIRNWPGPRIVWDSVSDRIAPCLQQPGQIPFLIGCDCSVVVGTTQALLRTSSAEIHVLYVDGDFDDAAPDAGHCHSAAACAVWLLTNDSAFWAGPALRPANVSVIGWSSPSLSPKSGVGSISLAEIRRAGPVEAAQRALQKVPASASILLHFDSDVVQAPELPSAYFPHDEGLKLSEAGQILRVLLSDSRIRIIEVSEYASLRDLDHGYIAKLVGLLSDALGR